MLLRDYLEANPHLTQRVLARSLDITEGYMSQLLSGKRRVTKLEFACRIESVTGIAAASFFENSYTQKENRLVVVHG